MSDDRYLTRLVSRRPAREWFTDSGQPSSEALYFFYRESPVALFITCSDSRINPNLITQTDALTHSLVFRYDALNRLLQVIDPAGDLTRYAYDAAGRVTRGASGLVRTAEELERAAQLWRAGTLD